MEETNEIKLKNEKEYSDKILISNYMLEWWVETVILAFFPIIISMLMAVLRYTYLDVGRMIGDGELILSSFSISTPSLISHYREKNKESKSLFYLLMFSTFFQLITYVTIKTNSANKSSVVYLASFICVITSVILSAKSEDFIKGEKQ